MNITIPDYYKVTEIVAAVREAEPGSVLCCSSDRQFSLLKIALVKLQKSDLTVQLVDQLGYMVKQVRTRKRDASQEATEGLNGEQLQAVRRLEQAFAQCRKQGLLVVGFSDGLVAVPEALGSGLDILSSTAATEVDAADAYRGYEVDTE